MLILISSSPLPLLVFLSVIGVVSWIFRDIMAANDTVRVLIAGAGIGGLATAISLSRVAAISNVDIQLYEQAPELLEIGASIALSPNVRLSVSQIQIHII